MRSDNFTDLGQAFLTASTDSEHLVFPSDDLGMEHELEFAEVKIWFLTTGEPI